MTKEEARELLGDFIASKNWIEHRLDLPEVDEVINKISSDYALNVLFDQYTFKGLLKIAYDLKDAE